MTFINRMKKVVYTNTKGEKKMSKAGKSLWNRLMASVLSAVMVLGLLPISFSDVYAADPAPVVDPLTCVTINIKDTNGSPVTGATVTYKLTNPSVPDFIAVEGVASDLGAGYYFVSSEENYKTYPAGLMLEATISMTDYHVHNIVPTEVTSGTQSIAAVLYRPATGSITVSEKTLDYNYGNQDLLSTANTNGYSVQYKVGNATDWSSTVPQARAPGKYSITVKISKSGYDTVTYDTVETEIKEIDAFNSTRCNDFTYDGADHKSITWISNTTNIFYQLNNQTETTTIPTIKNVGSYTVKVYMKDPNCNNAIISREEHTINVSPKSINDNRIDQIQGYTGVYDGNSHVPIRQSDITALSQDYSISYSTDTTLPYDLTKNYSWKTDTTIKEVGSPSFLVKISDKNDANIFSLKKVTASITIANQQISFLGGYKNNETTPVSCESTEFPKPYDFSIVGGDPATGVTYSIKGIGGGAIDTSVAEITQDTGSLTVRNYGTFVITATKEGNGNNNGVSISHTLQVLLPGKIRFAQGTVSYTVGTKWDTATNSEIISNQTAINVNADDNGRVEYSIDRTDVGLECSPAGVLKVLDQAVLFKALHDSPSKSLTIPVTAKKLAGSRYGPASATYNVEIKFLATPESPYSIPAPASDGWYPAAVTVTPSTDYTISLTTPETFGASVTLNQSGDYVIYLRNTISGGITDQISIPTIKIDSTNPTDMLITLSDANREDTNPSVSYYNKPLTVTFYASTSSQGSAMDHFDWVFTYELAEGETVPKTISGTITSLNHFQKFNKDVYSASITFPSNQEQLRGTISFTAEKQNTNSAPFYLKPIVVYDTTSPTCTVKMDEAAQDVNGHLYYSNTSGVSFDVNIKDENFDEKKVVLKVTRDGVESQISNISGWVAGEANDFSRSFSFTDEGDYHIEIYNTDKAGNVMDTYTLPDFTIDTTLPKVSIDYNPDEQSAKVTIEEHNFRQDDVFLSIISKDINGSLVDPGLPDSKFLQSCVWEKVGDTYTTEILVLKDGNHTIEVNYSDLAKNPAVPASTSGIVIDHLAPDVSTMAVEYSVPIHESFLQFITWGFYNPSVTVTFTAKDEISGIDHFDWTFTPRNDSGDKNMTSLSGTLPVSSETDIGTASLVLSAEKFDQMKGNISFTATDKMGNESNPLTDDKRIIVVDTISPTMNVEYGPADRTDNGNLFYKGEVPVKLSVTEANFYAENIRVTASRDGGKEIAITPVWTDASNEEAPDLHIGTFTLAAPADQSADGDYVITISYGDYSGNKMTGEANIESGVYTSNIITIDTLAPVVNVVYSNTNTVNVTKDPKGNDRSYFAAAQTATITVKEHNFKAEEVQFIISTEDITGKALEQNTFLQKSEWVSEGDSHTIVFTYPGDANYSFDLEYKDTATNAMADRPVDYFTVDKTAPENLSISYSESLMETILENISFGFYNAKTTVTITADDSVAGIFGISYNGNQTSQNVRYSNSNKTASIVFDLPGSSSDSQFDGYVEFDVLDRSGNKIGKKDDKRIIVDSISPTASVSFNKPVFEDNKVSYYDQDIQGQITINEANFFAKDVSVMVAKDGESATTLDTSWASSDKDTHIGSFTLKEDGNYVISISYQDNSKNSMTNYQSQVMTIDTVIEKPVISINGKVETGRAYRDDVIPAISVEDVNYSKYEITMTRTNFGTKNADVKDLFIKDVKESETGATGTFDTFEANRENDGIYKLTVSVEDKAGNVATSSVVFTVNRFGSVYEYSDYLASLVKDGGAYVSSISEDLVIMEYNPDQILEDSLQIEVTRDGKPVSDLVFSTDEVKNEITDSEEGGWYQYQYTIGKANFAQDGIYKISVSTIDATGNTMENNKSEGQAIIFHVDNEAPEITSIRGLEKEIIDATKLDVQYTVYDTIGLKSVQVFVDGVEVGSAVTDFSGDLNNYSGTFSMKESGVKQAVRIVVEDLAGNITDTDSSTFKSAFTFQRNITISTNFFVRWYANGALFWGSTLGVVAIAGVLITLIVNRRLRSRRKR